MRYYVHYSEEGQLIAIGTGPGHLEITKEEYDALLYEIQSRAELANKLYFGEITIDEVPIEWQEEVQREVAFRVEVEGPADEQNISAEEAMDIIFGGEV